jgi:hypothetical protein
VRIIFIELWFQLELATRQNNLNSLVRKKKVADNVKLCMALLKQREKEMLEEIESKRVENEQALALQQVQGATFIKFYVAMISIFGF